MRARFGRHYELNLRGAMQYQNLIPPAARPRRSRDMLPNLAVGASCFIPRMAPHLRTSRSTDIGKPGPFAASGCVPEYGVNTTKPQVPPRPLERSARRSICLRHAHGGPLSAPDRGEQGSAKTVFSKMIRRGPLILMPRRSGRVHARNAISSSRSAMGISSASDNLSDLPCWTSDAPANSRRLLAEALPRAIWRCL